MIPHVFPRWRKVDYIINFSAKGTMSRKRRILRQSANLGQGALVCVAFFVENSLLSSTKFPKPIFNQGAWSSGQNVGPAFTGAAIQSPQWNFFCRFFCFSRGIRGIFKGNSGVDQGESDGFSREIRRFFKGNPRVCSRGIRGFFKENPLRCVKKKTQLSYCTD